MESLESIQKLLDRISMSLFGIQFKIRCEVDNKYRLVFSDKKLNGRIFIQIVFNAHCQKENMIKEWAGRKYYLSGYMTEDEIVKTAYVAFENTVKHEILEAFKVDGIILFNPHVNFEELLKINFLEVSRKLTIGEKI